MLRGQIDSVNAAGLFEGWALDDAAPMRPLEVEIADAAGRALASGAAHLYRRDAGPKRRGSDWAGFRLRASAPPARLRGGAFALLSRGRLIAADVRPWWVERVEPALDSLEALAASDPTILPDIAALEGSAGMLAAFVAARGVDVFVRTAHLYVLGRPVDAETFLAFRLRLGEGRVTPLGVIQAFAGGAEFARAPRALAAPNADGFPFALR